MTASMDQLLCDSTTRNHDCYLRLCNNCPDSSAFEQDLIQQLEEKNIDEIQFEQWITTEKCDIESIIKPVD